MAPKFTTPEAVDAHIDALLKAPPSVTLYDEIKALLAVHNELGSHEPLRDALIARGAILRGIDRIYDHLNSAAR